MGVDYFFILILICNVSLNCTQSHINWTALAPPANSPLLPRADSEMAICMDNQTIHILGGVTYPFQWVQFDPFSYTITDKGIDPCPVRFAGPPPADRQMYQYGSSQYYTQIFNVFYWLKSKIQSVQIPLFDDFNSTVAVNYTAASAPSHQTTSACLASSASLNEIYWIGGDNGKLGTLSKVDVLDLTSLSWYQAPSMNAAREDLSCIYLEDVNELFVIGGYSKNSGGQRDTIERISITNAGIRTSWLYFPTDLVIPVRDSRAVHSVIDKSIVVIGGQDGASARGEVQVIDYVSETVSVVTNLVYPVNRHSVVLMNDNIIYIFGGRYAEAGGGVGVNTNVWQMLVDIEGYQPPTNVPSRAPTSHPSNMPSSSPTKSPTSHPSDMPSLSPIKQPSIPPINAISTSFTAYSSTVFVNTEDRNNSVENEPKPVDVALVYLVSIIIVLACASIVSLSCVLKMRKKASQNNETMNQMEAQQNTPNVAANSQHVTRPESPEIASSDSNSEELYVAYDDNNNVELQTAGKTTGKEIECNDIETAGAGLEGMRNLDMHKQTNTTGVPI
eukprot:80713_1